MPAPSAPDPGTTPTEVDVVPPRRSSIRAPWVVATLTVVVAVTAVAGSLAGWPGKAGPSASQGTGIREHGSATPEAAARYLAESVIAGDFDAALSAFTVETAFEHYSFAAEAEQLDAVPWASPLPGEANRAINQQVQRGSVATGLVSLTRSLLLPEVNPGRTYLMDSGEDPLSAAEIASGLDPAGLGSVSVARVDVVDATPDARTVDELSMWTPDDVRMVTVLFDTPHGSVARALTALKYGRSWYVLSFGPPSGAGPMAEFDAEATLSPAEYAGLLADARAFYDLR